MCIRDATTTDADAIARVHHDSLTGALKDLVPRDILGSMSLEERRTRWLTWLSGPEWITLVAEVAGRIVGFGTVGPSRDEDAREGEVAEIPTLYVQPGHWRQGVGRGLCAAVAARARALGYRELTLWTLEANENARHFYAALGFVPDGASKVDTDPAPTDLVAVRLRMALS